MNTKKNFFDYASTIISLAIICIVPFIVTGSFFFPYITGKNFIFRVLVEILGALWIFGFLRGIFPKPQKSPVLLSLGVFLGLATLSTIFSVDPLRSFWSNYERMEGLVTYLHFGVYVFVLLSFLKTKAWDVLWASTLGASAGMSFFALYQLLGFAVINQGGARVDGTFGNAIYLAVYMLFHIFIAFLAFRQYSSRGAVPQAFIGTVSITLLGLFLFLWNVGAHETQSAIAFLISLLVSGLVGFGLYRAYKKFPVLFAQIFLAFLALFYTVILFYTGTRGAVLGLGIGVVLMSLSGLLLGTVSRIEKKIAAICIGLCLLSVGGFFALRSVPAVATHPVLGRIFTISTSDTTVQARFLVWGMAIEGFKEHPVLGWGLEGFRNVFDKYYNPKMYAQEQWFDRTHNIILDWLVAGGVLGLLSYLALFAALLWMLWKKRKVLGGEFPILLGLIAAYCVHNLFVFDNIQSLILFGALIAYIHGRYTESNNSEPARVSLPVKVYGQVATTVFVVCVLGTSLYQMNANMNLINALQSAPKNPTTAPVLFKKALATNSYGKTETREQLVQFAVNVASVNIPLQSKQEIAALVGTEMLAHMQEHPHDARTWLFSAILWRQFGLLPDAEIFIKKALALSPKKQTLRFEFVNLLLAQKKFEEAYAVSKDTYELEPSFEEARTSYIVSAIYAGKKAEVQGLLREKFGTKPITDTRIIGAYVANKDFKTALALLTAIPKTEIARDQQFLLASVYLELGRRAESVATLREAAKQYPEIAKEIEGAVADINAGKNPFK